jgi:hypothetical protein
MNIDDSTIEAITRAVRSLGTASHVRLPGDNETHPQAILTWDDISEQGEESDGLPSRRYGRLRYAGNDFGVTVVARWGPDYVDMCYFDLRLGFSLPMPRDFQRILDLSAACGPGVT